MQTKIAMTMAVALATVVSAWMPCGDELPDYDYDCGEGRYFDTLACECFFLRDKQCDVEATCKLAGDNFKLDPREECKCMLDSEFDQIYPNWATREQMDESDIASAVCFEPELMGVGFDMRVCNFAKDFEEMMKQESWPLFERWPMKEEDEDGDWIDDLFNMSESAFASQASLLLAAIAVSTSALF